MRKSHHSPLHVSPNSNVSNIGESTPGWLQALVRSGAVSGLQAERITECSMAALLPDDWWVDPCLRSTHEHTRAFVERELGAKPV